MIAAVMLGLLFLAGGVASGFAQDASQATTKPWLNDEDLSDIARVEDYLNATTTMKARFIQMASTGETSEGDIMLWRPGRLRIDYDPPSPIVITANGLFLVYQDTELDQLTHIPLGITPAGILVGENVKLNSGGLEVVDVRRGASTLEVTVIQRDDPFAGRVTLVFTDRPLRLQRWVVLDAQGITTNFALIGVQSGVTLDPALFKTNKPLVPQERR